MLMSIIVYSKSMNILYMCLFVLDIRSALLLGEGFILSVVGRFFFLHTPPPHFMSPETAHPINQNT